jgi:hypothetical protein
MQSCNEGGSSLMLELRLLKRGRFHVRFCRPSKWSTQVFLGVFSISDNFVYMSLVILRLGILKNAKRSVISPYRICVPARRPVLDFRDDGNLGREALEIFVSRYKQAQRRGRRVGQLEAGLAGGHFKQ